MRIVITGGGTGGHLFPAMAVHDALRARRPEADALFVGAARGVEATILPRRGYAFRGLTATPVSGKGWRGRLAAAWALPGTIRQAGRFLREFRPQVVFGVGGYASVPTVLAAGLARIPRVIHEQNAVPGLANRVLGRIASAVAVSFADTARCFPAGRTQVTGNPVRAEIRAGDARAARVRLDLDPEAFTVLVFGGSQGARRLNQAMGEALPALAAERAGLQFVHATGAQDLADVRRAYQASGMSARVEPFFEEMALAYQAADFAICRAGAGTLFELGGDGDTGPAGAVPLRRERPPATERRDRRAGRGRVDASRPVLRRAANRRQRAGGAGEAGPVGRDGTPRADAGAARRRRSDRGPLGAGRLGRIDGADVFKKIRRIHFVGIGGIGMSGIAEVLHNLGYGVSGSDSKASETTRRLGALGLTVTIGHRAENVGTADVVVRSSAVTHENPEIAAARQRLVPVIQRAEMLAELMRMKYGVAVAGTHGKTTTTSLVATVLARGGLDPTMVIGGRLNALGSNAKLGRGDFLVAEADESDGSFLKLSPTIAVVTTIDAEHLDYYRDLAHIQDVFVQFINKVPFYGLAVLCLDQENIQAILPQVEKRYVTYGLRTQADLLARDITFAGMTSACRVSWKGEPLGRLTLKIPGLHNVYNALAAVAVGLDLDLPFEVIRDALGEFSGVDRRFQVRGEARGDHGGGRLRPSSRRDPSDAQRRQGWLRPAGVGRVPAPSLHPDPGPALRFFHRLLPGGSGVRHRDLPSRGAADPGGERPADRRGGGRSRTSRRHLRGGQGRGGVGGAARRPAGRYGADLGRGGRVAGG